MTNSFFYFQEAADYASELQRSYDQINRGYERREQLERENDRIREINAAMPMQMIESLADFSITMKKANDARLDKQYEDLEDQKYSIDDPEEDKKYTDKVEFMTNLLPTYNEAIDTAVEDKDVLALEALKNSPHAALNDRMRYMQGMMNSVPSTWYTKGYDEAYNGAVTPAQQAQVIAAFRNAIERPLFKTENRRLVKNTVGRKIDDFLKTVRRQGVEDLTKKQKAENASLKNSKLMQALDESYGLYTIDNYRKEYAHEFSNGMGGVSHDVANRVVTLAEYTDEVSTDKAREILKMDAGGVPYEDRFPVIAGKLHARLAKIDKAESKAIAAKKNQLYDSKNEAGLKYAREQLKQGVDAEVIKRNLLELQGNNRLEFGKENTEIDTFVEGLDQSYENYIAINADFEERYEKGQLTVEEVEASSFELQNKWLSRAQAQQKARQDKNYKDSKSAVEQIVKSKSSVWQDSSRGSLLPHTNAVRGKLIEKFEEEFTRLTDAGDPNAAVNAALAVETYFTKNGGGEVAVSEEDGRLFVLNSEGIYENYMNSIAPATKKLNATTALATELYSTAVKLEMADNNIQKALDQPNVFLNEAEVNEEITRLASREGYSPKLEALAGLYGKHEAVGGARGILERQAAVYGIKKEEIPEELQSISEIYSQGDPFINCLIREKGFDGVTANQLLRQCAFMSEKGTDDEELEITKRPAFQ